MPYGAHNIEDLLDSQSTVKIDNALLRDIDWLSLSEDHVKRLQAKVPPGLLRSTIGSKWSTAQRGNRATVDRLKGLDMDAHPDFLSLRSRGEFSPEGWFLYFWKEAKGNISSVPSTDLPHLDQMASTLFAVRGSDLTVAPAMRTGGVASGAPNFDGWLQANPNHPVLFGRWLEILLKAGFVPYVADKGDLALRRSQGANPTGELAAVDNVALAKEFVEVPFTWRADTRPLSALQVDGGFNTKADQTKPWSATHGLREAWNPFSKDEINKVYWFRKASEDNCKYSVVSVGLESNWRKVVSFPRLCDLDGWPSALFSKTSGTLMPFDKLSATDQKQVDQWFRWGWMLPAQCMVDGKLNSRPVLLPAVRTYLYLMILGGVVLNTNKVQGKGGFPEVGVKSLSLRNIYGAVEVVRFYHGGDDPAGYTGFVASSQTVTNQARTKRFQAIEKQLEAAYADLQRQMGPLHLAWAANGSATVPAGYSYRGKKMLVVGVNNTAKPLQCDIIW